VRFAGENLENGPRAEGKVKMSGKEGKRLLVYHFHSNVINNALSGFQK
jgi:hypothetical protein